MRIVLFLNEKGRVKFECFIVCSATALANEGNIEDAVPLYLHALQTFEEYNYEELPMIREEIWRWVSLADQTSDAQSAAASLKSTMNEGRPSRHRQSPPKKEQQYRHTDEYDDERSVRSAPSSGRPRQVKSRDKNSSTADSQQSRMKPPPNTPLRTRRAGSPAARETRNRSGL